MADQRKGGIPWTDITDNIIIAEGGGWWCRKSSPACDNCYAEALNRTPFFGGNGLPYTGQPPALKLRRDIIKGWQRQRKPKKHFVMSMSDVFGPWVPREWQHEMLDGMYAAPRQTFQVLSKWSHIARRVLVEWMCSRGVSAPPNIWPGFTAENQEWFDRRWEHMKVLADYGYTVFVSLEPLLERVRLPESFLRHGDRVQVIIGGESGPNARPFYVGWARDLLRQCQRAGVPAFMKQLGAWPYDHWTLDRLPLKVKEGGRKSYPFLNLKDAKGGDPAEWEPALNVRQFPATAP